MVYTSENDIFQNGSLAEENGKIVIKNADALRGQTVHDLASTIILSDNTQLKKYCCWIAHEAAIQLGAIPSSIQGLYDAMGQGEAPGFTVPAINLRTLTFDLCRSVFACAQEINAAAFIFEIAKSEIGYTFQRPQEYAAMVLLAAIKENYTGPIFIQGDHFQLNTKNYRNNPQAEMDALKKLIVEAINCGYYNIDIDTSNLVDLSQENINDQQKSNCEICAELTRFIRSIEPHGITISIGGEIGETSNHNSTAEEFNAFMACYCALIGTLKGISKLSVQTGTRHGGVILPDGTIAKVKLDFDTLKNLSLLAREKYFMSGCVQQGASTLPNEAFHNFPEVGCTEIHLATQFQNIVYDYMPIPLKEKIYAWLHENFAHEKPGQTIDQFIYRTRKHALGPFKKEIALLPSDMREKIARALKQEFSFLFGQLKINDTRPIVEHCVKTIPLSKPKKLFLEDAGTTISDR